MTRTSDRHPMLFSRVPADERDEYQRIADELYDGNLSLFVRQACREKAERHRRDAEKERAA